MTACLNTMPEYCLPSVDTGVFERTGMDFFHSVQCYRFNEDFYQVQISTSYLKLNQFLKTCFLTIYATSLFVSNKCILHRSFQLDLNNKCIQDIFKLFNFQVLKQISQMYTLSLVLNLNFLF